MEQIKAKPCISSATCCGISSTRSVVYHQAAGKYTLARDEIQPQRGWWYTPHFARRWYAKPAAWINKKGTFGRQKFLFCWRRRRDCLGTQAFRCTVATTDFFCPRSSLGWRNLSCCHSKNLPLSATGGGRFFSLSRHVARVQISPVNEKRTPFGVLFVGGEGEIWTLAPVKSDLHP